MFGVFYLINRIAICNDTFGVSLPYFGQLAFVLWCWREKRDEEHGGINSLLELEVGPKGPSGGMYPRSKFN